MSDEKEKKSDAPMGWVDEDEQRAAAAQAKHVCPSCGDWLPLELNEYKCLGQGHHVAVSRTSVYPEGPAQRELQKARRSSVWADLALAAFVLALLALIFTVLLRDQ